MGRFPRSRSLASPSLAAARGPSRTTVRYADQSSKHKLGRMWLDAPQRSGIRSKVLPTPVNPQSSTWNIYGLTFALRENTACAHWRVMITITPTNMCAYLRITTYIVGRWARIIRWHRRQYCPDASSIESETQIELRVLLRAPRHPSYTKRQASTEDLGTQPKRRQIDPRGWGVTASHGQSCVASPRYGLLLPTRATPRYHQRTGRRIVSQELLTTGATSATVTNTKFRSWYT